jgi:hypothetical protein
MLMKAMLSALGPAGPAPAEADSANAAVRIAMTTTPNRRANPCFIVSHLLGFRRDLLCAEQAQGESGRRPILLPRFPAESVETWLASDKRPRPVFQLLAKAQEELDELRVIGELRTELGQQARLVVEGALLARARLEDVDRL